LNEPDNVLIDLLRKMLDKDPKTRINIAQILVEFLFISIVPPMGL
jgi:serine/threonine protein kinase